MKIGEEYHFVWGVGIAVASVLLAFTLEAVAADPPDEDENPSLLMEPLVKPQATPVAQPELKGPGKAAEKTPKVTTAKPAKKAAASKETTLVGRGGKAAVVTGDGTAEEVGAQNLKFRNQGAVKGAKSVSDPSAEAQPQPGAGQEAKTTEKPVPKKAAAPVAKTNKKEEAAKKAAAEAIRQKDIERLRALEREGAWFYTKDNKPISSAELDKRIAAGEVNDIKTVDIHLQPWITEKVPDTKVQDNKAGKPKSPAAR